MAAPPTLVSVAQYLSTSYSPDREYVDGVIVERNWGEKGHSKTQRKFITYLDTRAEKLGIHVFPEQRIQVKPTHFRVPDICVVVGQEPEEEIFTLPPFLCIEILSKDDRAGDVQDKVDDYLAFGVRYVWLIDPIRRRAWVHTADGSHEAKDGALRTESPEIVVPLAEIFAAL